MYVFSRHGHRLDARDLIEYPWSVLKLSVSLIMNHPWWFIRNSLDSDQARNFDKVSNCLKLCRICIHEIGPGPRHEIYFSAAISLDQHAELIHKQTDINTGFATR